VFIGGVAWSWCFLRFRSILPGYLSHVIVDIAVLVVGWVLLFAPAS
jgi:membrane protease YdiL (CAAX protease family)